MWYKIVLNKDGSIASCEEAAQSLDQGRSVIFVEAESRRAAMLAAKVRRNARKMAYDHKLTALGLCRDCRKPARAGKLRCVECSERKSRYDKERARGTYVPPTSEERSQRRIGRPKTSNERLILLYECRKVFDERGHREFRRWLQGQIDASFSREGTAAE
jgi:hypothetical protein